MTRRKQFAAALCACALLALGMFAGRFSLLWQGPLLAVGDADVVDVPPLSLSDYAVEENDEVRNTLLVNINTAGEEELCKLQGIGPVKAGRIIEYRQKNGAFQSTDELRAVKGIGDKTYEKIRDHVTIG